MESQWVSAISLVDPVLISAQHAQSSIRNFDFLSIFETKRVSKRTLLGHGERVERLPIRDVLQDTTRSASLTTQQSPRDYARMEMSAVGEWSGHVGMWQGLYAA